MRQMLRNLGALPLALAAILTLVWLMQTLIGARPDDNKQQPPIPSVVYLIEAAATDAETPQPEVEAPEQPQPEPEPPEPPEPQEPEALPETLELPLDLRPLDLPAVAKPPEPKPKPRPKPKVRKKPVSQPKVASQPTASASAKPAAPKPAAAATFDRRATFAPKPKYPTIAKRRRIEGSVTVKFTVTREGRVRNPQVIAAQPPGIFDRAALDTIQRWRFRPQAADFPGVTQKIRFDLRN